MSVRLTTAAWDCPADLTKSELLLLLKLADQSRDDGLCWPSQNTLARHCRVSRRTIIRLAQSLEQKGLLQIKQRPGRSAYYQLTLLNRCDTVSHPVPEQPVGEPVDKNGGCDTVSQVGVTPRHRGCDTHVTGGVTPMSHHRTVREPSSNQTQAADAAGVSVDKDEVQKRVQRPHWADKQIWNDWLRSRKAPLTPTAWKAVEAELAKGVAAGFDRNAMLRVAAERSWRGFKCSWYVDAVKKDGDGGGSLGAKWDAVIAAAALGSTARREWMKNNPDLVELVNRIGGLQQIGQAQPRQLNELKSRFFEQLKGAA